LGETPCGLIRIAPAMLDPGRVTFVRSCDRPQGTRFPLNPAPGMSKKDNELSGFSDLRLRGRFCLTSANCPLTRSPVSLRCSPR
jgi:hypothetical protein